MKNGKSVHAGPAPDQGLTLCIRKRRLELQITEKDGGFLLCDGSVVWLPQAEDLGDARAILNAYFDGMGTTGPGTRGQS